MQMELLLGLGLARAVAVPAVSIADLKAGDDCQHDLASASSQIFSCLLASDGNADVNKAVQCCLHLQ